VFVAQKDFHRAGNYRVASYRLLFATSSAFRAGNTAPPLLLTLFSFSYARSCFSSFWTLKLVDRRASGERKKKNSASPLWDKSSRKFQWPSSARKTRSFLISRRAKALFHKPEYTFCRENKVWEAERKFNLAIFERACDGNLPSEALLLELAIQLLSLFLCVRIFTCRLFFAPLTSRVLENVFAFVPKMLSINSLLYLCENRIKISLEPFRSLNLWTKQNYF